MAPCVFNQPGVSNLAIGPANNLPQLRIVNTWQAQDNWNFVVGKHTFKAGVNYTFQRSPNIFLPNLKGTFRFPDWSGFLNNTPNRIRSLPEILRWTSVSTTPSSMVEMTGKSATL